MIILSTINLLFQNETFKYYFGISYLIISLIIFIILRFYRINNSNLIYQFFSSFIYPIVFVLIVIYFISKFLFHSLPKKLFKILTPYFKIFYIYLFNPLIGQPTIYLSKKIFFYILKKISLFIYSIFFKNSNYFLY